MSELLHYGVGHDKGGHSGRFPWGSGDAPYQRDDFLQTVRAMKKEGKTEQEIADHFQIYTKTRDGTQIPSIKQLRIQISMAETTNRKAQVEKVEKLREEGKSLKQIADIMGFANDSSVRSLLNTHSKERMSEAENTKNKLKEMVDNSEHGMLDVGKANNYYLGVSQEKMDTALYMLELEGYNIYGGGQKQVTNGDRQTNMKVLAVPEAEHKDIFKPGWVSAIDKIESHDGGDTWQPTFVEPVAVDRDRIWIREPKDGGADRDGTIEVKRGVQDLYLGEGCNYAQVRVRTSNGYYLKGMAVYGSDEEFPKGVDIIFNSSKPDGSDDDTVFKKLKTRDYRDEDGKKVLEGYDKDGKPKYKQELDYDNPFGALIKPGINEPEVEGEKRGFGGQSYYIDKETGEKKLSAINKTREEGDWDEWSRNLPSQFLAKQSPTLVKNQLKLTMAEKQEEFEKLDQLDNPTIKKKMMLDFAETCDKDAKTLSAAALPGQSYQVLLPGGPTLKEKEIYAPSLNDGDTVALVRFPHGGKFEIPILTVNNKNKYCQEVYGSQAKDCVAIHKNAAEILSGADFDGDTALIIPCNSANSNIKILGGEPLKQLVGFDNKHEYPDPAKANPELAKTYKYLTKESTQPEMGKVSNLIFDMTLKGASEDELARAVKHSMVIIDAAKHKLDWQKSYTDNGIEELKNKYMLHEVINPKTGEPVVDPETGEVKMSRGASTLLTMAKSDERVPKRQGSYHINKETGEKEWNTADDKKRYYRDFNLVPDGVDSEGNTKYRKEEYGPVKERTTVTTKMDEAPDAYNLVSDMNNTIECAYADYANFMKQLGNKARLASLSENTGSLKYDPEAKKLYKEEYDSIREKLKEAEMNAPRERKAQYEANALVQAKKEEAEENGEELSRKDLKKYAQLVLNKARAKYGAKGRETKIKLSENEWNAVQAGAITESILSKVLTHMDKDQLLELATPRTKSKAMTDAQIRKFKALKASGYTIAQIAAAVGCSASTVRKYLSEV